MLKLNEEKSKNYIYKIIIIILLLTFFSDIVTSFLEFYNFEFYRVSAIFRFLAELFFIFLMSKSKKGIRLLFYILILLLFYVVGALNSKLIIDNYNLNIFQNLIILNKYFYLFISWFVISKYFEILKYKRQIFKVYELIIIIVCVSIIIGFIFKIELFSTYSIDYRSGYRGIFPGVGYVSYFIIIALNYYLNKIFNDNSNKLDIFLSILVIIAGFLTGIRVCWIFIPMILAGYVILHFRRFLELFKKNYLITFSIIIIILISIFLLRENLYSFINVSKEYFLVQYNTSASRNFISFALSLRDVRAVNFLNYIKDNWNIVNYLFGGFNSWNYLVEIDPLDVFALFGLAGFFLYYYIFYKILDIKRKVNLNLLLFQISTILISFTVGLVSTGAINAIYFAIVLNSFEGYSSKSLVEE